VANLGKHLDDTAGAEKARNCGRDGNMNKKKRKRKEESIGHIMNSYVIRMHDCFCNSTTTCYG
jgi:hypothetical protein